MPLGAGPGGCASLPCAGRVNTNNGNVLVQSGPPRAGTFDPRPLLSYNTLSIQAGEVGYGWTHMFRRSIQAVGSNAANVVTGTASIYSYTSLNPTTGFYTPPSGTANTLLKSPSGWVETQPDGLSYNYNSSGALQTIKTAAGGTWSLTYSGAGLLASITDPFGRLSSFGYDGSGNIKSYQDSGGRITSYTVDTAGDLVQIISPELCLTSLGYDAVHRLKTWTNALGECTTFGYDDQSRLVQVTAPMGQLTSYSYLSNQTGVTDPLGNTQTILFNGNSQLQTLVDALGNRTSFTWNGNYLATAVERPGKRNDVPVHDIAEWRPVAAIGGAPRRRPGHLYVQCQQPGSVSSRRHGQHHDAALEQYREPRGA